MKTKAQNQQDKPLQRRRAIFAEAGPRHPLFVELSAMVAAASEYYRAAVAHRNATPDQRAHAAGGLCALDELAETIAKTMESASNTAAEPGSEEGKIRPNRVQ